MYFVPKEIETIATHIGNGKIGIFPCDTILGIVGLATKENSLKIAAIKERENCPFIVLLPSIEHLDEVSELLTDDQQFMMKSYWPGPVTFIVNKAKAIDKSITAGKNSIGLRLPDFLPLNYLLKQVDRPIISTSVNKHSHPAALIESDISKDILSQVDFCYTGTIAKQSNASTIVDLSVSPNKILRQGDLHIELTNN